MRNLKPVVAVILLSVCSLCAYSQKDAPITEPNYNKPQLFSSLPDNIKVNINALKNLLNSSVGDAISSDLKEEHAPNSKEESPFVFSGRVISMASQYNTNIQSVVVRSANFAGAGLTFTQFKKEDGSIGYSGYIISFDAGDAYELQLIDGNYQFVKKKFHQLINE